MKINWIKIDHKKYGKSEYVFDDGLNIIHGENMTGKSFLARIIYDIFGGSSYAREKNRDAINNLGDVKSNITLLDGKNYDVKLEYWNTGGGNIDKKVTILNGDKSGKTIKEIQKELFKLPSIISYDREQKRTPMLSDVLSSRFVDQETWKYESLRSSSLSYNYKVNRTAFLYSWCLGLMDDYISFLKNNDLKFDNIKTKYDVDKLTENINKTFTGNVNADLDFERANDSLLKNATTITNELMRFKRKKSALRKNKDKVSLINQEKDNVFSIIYDEFSKHNIDIDNDIMMRFNSIFSMDVDFEEEIKEVQEKIKELEERSLLVKEKIKTNIENANNIPTTLVTATLEKIKDELSKGASGSIELKDIQTEWKKVLHKTKEEMNRLVLEINSNKQFRQLNKNYEIQWNNYGTNISNPGGTQGQLINVLLFNRINKAIEGEYAPGNMDYCPLIIDGLFSEEYNKDLKDFHGNKISIKDFIIENILDTCISSKQSLIFMTNTNTDITIRNAETKGIKYKLIRIMENN